MAKKLVEEFFLRKTGLRKSRLEALTDAIFAIAMTVLVLNITVPASFGGSQAMVLLALERVFPELFHYLIAFIVLAGFWVTHHYMSEHVRYIDSRLLWLNIASLMLVALIPFSTNFADTFVNQAPISAAFFELNVLAISIVYYLQWKHGLSKKEMLKKDVSKEISAHIRKRVYTTPALSLLAIALAVAGIPWSVGVYALTPLVYKL